MAENVLKLSVNKDQNNCGLAMKTKCTWINRRMREVPNDIVSKSHNNNWNNSISGVTSFSKLIIFLKINNI